MVVKLFTKTNVLNTETVFLLWYIFSFFIPPFRVCTASQWTVWIMQKHSSPPPYEWVCSDVVDSHKILTPISCLYSSLFYSLLLSLTRLLFVFQLTAHQELWTYIVTNLASVYIREGNRHQEVSVTVTVVNFLPEQWTLTEYCGSVT